MRVLLAPLLAFLLLLPASAAELETVTLETASGSHVFRAEIAATPAARSQGLMNRRTMAADHGMLFDFGEARPVMMWMKNTPLPLDMIFVDGRGTVTRIAADTTPFSEDIISSGGPVRFVLEVNAGTARRIGLKEGDRLRASMVGG